MALLECVRNQLPLIVGGNAINKQLSVHRRYLVRSGGLSPVRGRSNEFRLGSSRPGLVVVPPGVWHGVKNISNAPGLILNLVDRAHKYEDPDHWRLPIDTSEVPYSFDS